MDIYSIEQQKASSSTSNTNPTLPQTQLATTFSTDTTTTVDTIEPKPVRSSARVKAAKQLKEKGSKSKPKERDSEQPTASAALPESSTSRTTRSATNRSKRELSSSKVKGKDKSDGASRGAKRPRLSNNSPGIVINEPVSDTKGKKRALAEVSTEEEGTQPTSSKRKTTYSLRSGPVEVSSTKSTMPRKQKSTVSKVKGASKAKMLASASSSRLEDDDIEMLEADFQESELEEHMDISGGVEKVEETVTKQAVEAEEEENDDNGDSGEENGVSPPGDASGMGGGSDDPTGLAIFGDYRQFGSYLMNLSPRLKDMLINIKPSADPTTRLLALQELSELLSISTEDTLAGSFQVEQFVRELVKILGGRGGDEDEDEDGDEERPERDEDAELAAAIARSTGVGGFQGDHNLEAQVLACRCLANLMEALPGAAHTVVYHGAIPVLCSKLIEISYIDLAEQTLSTLEKISEEFPSSIVREGGLAALLNYLDFFSIAVQRTALQAASNCCRNVSSEHFPMIKGIWPIIRNCLAYSDQRLVEFACLCVIRVVDSYNRSSSENLEALVDTDLIRAVNILLLPPGGSPLIATNTYTLLLRSLAISARASPKITLALLEADIADTLYQILTGTLPPSHGACQDDSASQGLGGSITDMNVMENLANRPKDQLEEALSLVSELMPPLPKDGVFDHRMFTERSLARMVKAKAKADRAAARQAAAGHSASTPVTAPQKPQTPQSQETPNAEFTSQELQQQESDEPASAPAKPASADRTELLRSKPVIVGRFMRLMVHILTDVYAASVITPVRIKTMTGLLKAVAFADGDDLKRILTSVPVASFASSVLSSRDHPTLVIGALQLVELLLTKLSSEYKATFRREGVFHEIESLAGRELSTSKKEKEKDKEKVKDSNKDKDAEPCKEKEKGPSESSPPPESEPPAGSSSSSSKKQASASLEPEDAVTLRCRLLQFKFLSSQEQANEDSALESLRSLVERITASDASESAVFGALQDLAALFSSPHTSVSSFELLQSGVVDALLQFATDDKRSVSTQRRKELLIEAFATKRTKALLSSPTPFTTLVKKLQESLTRMEPFEVVTISQGSDDSKRSSPSLLARQLRLRLSADEDSDIPRNLQNIVVSIHAIATFQALHDYLRPRVAGLLSGGQRLSGMLAALAAGLEASTSSTVTPSRVPEAEPEAISTPIELELDSQTPTRRRSLRLSAKNEAASGSAVIDDPTNNAAKSSTSTDPAEPSVPDLASSEGLSSLIPEALRNVLADPNLRRELEEEEIDADVFDEEMDADTSATEKTITVSIAEESEDGARVEAQTPDGTRVTTPSNPKETQSPPKQRQLSSKVSYAAALKAKPSDWHIEFSMDDHVLPLDLTIYGAIHQHEMRKAGGTFSPNHIWQGTYIVRFKKVLGAPPSAEARDCAESSSRSRPATPVLPSLPDDTAHSKILRLLRVLFKLNTLEFERAAVPAERRCIPDSVFVNNKLTAKLTRQLEEPMVVASSCLPEWALDLPQHFPFVFPFTTRYNFLQSTSFGYARLILKWQSQQQTRGQDGQRRDDGIGFLGRLQRQKVRISRKHVLESAIKVFELYGSSSSILEVEYFEEVGTGLGPTLEFYSLVSKEFARRDLKIWRDSDPTLTGPYVHRPTGLYPAPIPREDIENDGGQKRTHLIRVVGQFVAKAMLDSRIIDLSFNKVFVKLILGEEVPLTVANLRLVDPDLANSLSKLQGFVNPVTECDKLLRKVAFVEDISIEDLALDFTLPGYDIELREHGRETQVTASNVHEYIQDVLDAILGKGALLQAKAFRQGFSKVFPVDDLRAFSADELVMLFGNSEEDWSYETLSEAIKADHGFNVESPAIRDLIEVMADYDPQMRRQFLQFISGSPKLPIGGFRGLSPSLTVVRKPHELPLKPDDYLPSVMTCVNYLKLPEYSSKEVMREKLRTAIREGVGSFHLS